VSPRLAAGALAAAAGRLWATLIRGENLALSYLQTIIERLDHMSGTLADLQAQVANNTSVVASAAALLKGLKERLDAAGTDPAALAALSSELAASDQALAAAVVANTPAESATTPPPLAGADVPPPS
jgi:peptidoglycan hydrolase CwlO-like protein